MGQEYSSLNRIPESYGSDGARQERASAHEFGGLPERLNLSGNEETERLCRKLQKHVALVSNTMPTVACSSCYQRGDLYLFPCDHVIYDASVTTDVVCPVCKSSTFHYFPKALKANSLFPFWNQQNVAHSLLLSKNMGRIPHAGRRGVQAVEALCVLLPYFADKNPKLFFNVSHSSRILYVMAQSVIESKKGISRYLAPHIIYPKALLPFGDGKVYFWEKWKFAFIQTELLSPAWVYQTDRFWVVISPQNGNCVIGTETARTTLPMEGKAKKKSSLFTEYTNVLENATTLTPFPKNGVFWGMLSSKPFFSAMKDEKRDCIVHVIEENKVGTVLELFGDGRVYFNGAYINFDEIKYNPKQNVKTTPETCTNHVIEMKKGYICPYCLCCSACKRKRTQPGKCLCGKRGNRCSLCSLCENCVKYQKVIQDVMALGVARRSVVARCAVEAHGDANRTVEAVLEKGAKDEETDDGEIEQNVRDAYALSGDDEHSDANSEERDSEHLGFRFDMENDREENSENSSENSSENDFEERSEEMDDSDRSF